jgi:uncharacterized lipoprotein YmbA
MSRASAGKATRAGRLFGTALLSCLVAGIHTGCATPVSATYLLLDLPRSPLPSGQEPALSVGPVLIPDYLKRNSLAVRLDDNTLSYRGSERWAEPLDLGIQRLLSAALGQALDTARVTTFPSPLATDAQLRVALNVFHLEAQGEEVILAAEWLIFRAGSSEPLRSGSIDRQRPLADSSGPSIAAAMSALLQDVAADVAGALRELGQAGAAQGA